MIILSNMANLQFLITTPLPVSVNGYINPGTHTAEMKRGNFIKD